VSGRSGADSLGGWFQLSSGGDWITGSGWTGGNGSSELNGLDSGIYDLAAVTDDGWAGVVHGIEVVAGETRELLFE